MAESVSYQARTLSSGTVAGLINDPRCDVIDHWRHQFHMWCLQREGEFACWQEAWKAFGPLHGFGDGEPAWMKRRRA